MLFFICDVKSTHFDTMKKKAIEMKGADERICALPEAHILVLKSTSIYSVIMKSLFLANSIMKLEIERINVKVRDTGVFVRNCPRPGFKSRFSGLVSHPQFLFYKIFFYFLNYSCQTYSPVLSTL